MEPQETSTPVHPRIRSVDIFNNHLPVAPILVVIPTYNERENIPEILNALNLPGVALDVLVVDDGSPDGTGDVVAEIAHAQPRRVLLMRRGGKYGLGVAYLDAHRWVMEHAPEYRFIVQMDADFSHDPHMIPSLIREAEAYGMAVGSRYVEGGAAPDWSRSRLLLSSSANTYLRFVLRMFFPTYPVRDNTSGFIAWRRDVLEAVLRNPILGDGYSFLTSLKLVAYREGFAPREVPIILRDRRLGVSKLNRHIMLEAFKMPWRLGWAFRFRRSNVVSSRPMPQNEHDNSVEMWKRYYASEDETGWFARFVHWGREHYFGDLFARNAIRLGGKASSYLELGVGTAQSLTRLQKRTGAQCTGIEITPSAYELGKKLATNCEIVLGDGMHMPFADKSFDVSYSLGLLEHFTQADQSKLLREQARVARNAVLVEVPAIYSVMSTIFWLNRTFLKKKGVWSDEELFSATHFRKKYPGLAFTYYHDWASGFLTCWFVLKPEDILAHIPE
jgi:dolichol-phosphate mannosyltransferase